MDDLDPYLDTTSSTCLWGTVWRMRLRRLSVTSGRPWPYVWDLSPTSTWRRPWPHWPRPCLPEDQCLAFWIWNTCTGLARVPLLWNSHVNNWFNGAMSWTTPIVMRDREGDSGYYRVHSVDCVYSLYVAVCWEVVIVLLAERTPRSVVTLLTDWIVSLVRPC